MKTNTTIFILIFSTILYGQDNDFVKPDSLAQIKIDYEVWGSTTMKQLSDGIIIDKKFPNVRKYFASERGFNIVYPSKDTSKWFALHFYNFSSNIQLINLDNQGQPELIVKSADYSYGSGGGTKSEWIVVINLDSVPTQILKIYYGCYIEDYGDKTKNGQGASSELYERQIKIKKTSIIISPLDKKKYPYNSCSMTEIPSGTYIMENGRILKKK